MSLKVGIIGCGRPGRGMAKAHGSGYRAAGAQIVALADIVRENAELYQQEYGGDRIYTDYRELLANEELDVVSVCTWPHLHAPIVIDAAKAKVRAIHCEKPMAPSYGEAKHMVEVCRENGVQLTFNHQRRFGDPFRKARDLVRAGEIGELQRMEGCCDNMFDWGTHWFDMFFFYNDETPAEWVLGQIEWRGARTLFGVPMDVQGLAQVRFANGVHGVLVTGKGHREWGARNRLIGSQGTIEVGVLDGGDEVTSLRIFNATSGGWKDIPTTENLHGERMVQDGIADLIDALESGREPELSAAKALRTTEVIFSVYESSRRQGRVNLPLDVDESALLAILKDHDAVPEGTLIQ